MAFRLPGANIDDPYGVDLDGAGNLYITSYDHDRVTRVDVVTGLIDTVLGTGVAGFNGDDTTANSRIWDPVGVFATDEGAVIAAEYTGHRIRLAADRPAAPEGLAVTVTGISAQASWSAGETYGFAVSAYGVAVSPSGPSVTVSGTTATLSGLTPSTSYQLSVTTQTLSGTSDAATASFAAPAATTTTTTTPEPSPPAVPSSEESGYWVVTNYGRVLPYGEAEILSTAVSTTAAEVVAASPTSSGDGYWIAHADGTVIAHGDASWFGDVSHLALFGDILAMATMPDDSRYILAAEDGGLFAFGSAGFHGSLGNQTLSAAIVDMAMTTTGEGYYMVGSNGAVYPFGDALFQGDVRDLTLDAPVAAITVADGAGGKDGYLYVGLDGGAFTHNVGFFGSIRSLLPHIAVEHLPRAVRIRMTDTGKGYFILTDDGQVIPFGDAVNLGEPKGTLAIDEYVVDLMLLSS